MSAAASILMIRPVNFGFNEQTAESNAFQIYNPEQLSVQQSALGEFNAFTAILKNNGIDIIIISDTPDPHTPDSIFPNNWVSFHEDGRVFLYPMEAENRRFERRAEIIEKLKCQFKITGIEDLSYFETLDKFLEGTGSMVLDRKNKIAFACLSPRTNAEVLQEFCKKSGFRSLLFNASDRNGKAIYHTNVLMCIAEKFAVICLDAISNLKEKNRVIESLRNTGKEIVEISVNQMNSFAGNMLELKSEAGENLLVMSERAYKSLNENQLCVLKKYSRIIFAPLNTIENNGGGSARCMIAEIHLPLKLQQ